MIVAIKNVGDDDHIVPHNYHFLLALTTEL